MREQYIEEEVITIGQIIRIVRDYLGFVLRKWWIILPIAAALAAYRIYVVYNAPAEYKAELSFTLYEEAQGPGGGITNLMGQFGLGSMDNVDFSRIIEFLTTRKIVGAALFKKVEIRGREDYFANHYLREFKLYEDWEEQEAVFIQDFWFTNGDVENFTPLENIVLNALWNRVINAHMDLEERGSGIIDMTLTTESAAFSIEFSKVLYNELAYFYAEKLNEKNLANFSMMEFRKDSIAAELEMAEMRFAKFQDSNKNVITARGLIEQVRLRRSVEVLNAIYVELVRTVEVLNFTLKRTTPYLVSIDEPVYPLIYREPDYPAEGLKYAIGGVLLTVFLLCGFKFVRDLLQADKEREEQRKQQKLRRAYEETPQPV